jgi:hypothetical protein
MAEGESGYKVGPGRPALHTRFKKGQSGNPRRPQHPSRQPLRGFLRMSSIPPIASLILRSGPAGRISRDASLRSRLSELPSHTLLRQ